MHIIVHLNFDCEVKEKTNSRKGAVTSAAGLIYFIYTLFYRLAKAFEELTEMIKNEEELNESDQYKAAVAVLEDAKVNLPH